MMMNEKIRIRLKAYDYRILDQSTTRDRRHRQAHGARVAGPIPLPTVNNRWTVNSLAPRGQEVARAVRDPHPQAAPRHLRAHPADGGRAHEAGPARGRGRRDQGVREGARQVAMAIEGIIGRKIGMTQVYAEDGRAIPATVIQAGPCVVVQRKTKAARTATHKNKKTGHTSTRQGRTATRRCSSAWSRTARSRRSPRPRPATSRDGRRPAAGEGAARVAHRRTATRPRSATRSRSRCSRPATPSTSSAPARARASRAWSSATTSAGARPRTARCSTARPAPSAPPPSPRVSRGCARPATWARTGSRSGT